MIAEDVDPEGRTTADAVERELPCVITRERG